MTWKRAKADNVWTCGSCKKPIGQGDTYALTRNSLVRCANCAKQIEDPPAVIDEDETVGVPPGVRHQASLGFESAGQLVGRHLANHLRVRSDR